MGVAEVRHLELGADQRGGIVRLDRADVHVAAGRAARQRQDMQHIIIGMVLGHRAAAADLDIVGMGADRQHALLLATAARVHGIGQQQACSTNSVGVAGLNSRPSIRHLTAWRRNCGSWSWVATSVAVQR